MRLSRSALILIPGLVLTVTGCLGLWSDALKLGNDDIATYKKVGDRYLIEVAGTRMGVSHDLAKHENYKDSYQFDVPRIEGAIDGREISRKPGYYGLAGTITIHGTEMVVKLSIDNYDEHRLDRFAWCGTYTLVEKK